MLVFWLTMLSACDDTTFGSHWETVDGEGLDGVVQVFDGNCVSCHSASNSSAGLALDGDFCDSIIDVEAQSGAGILVVPGNKEDSVLYQRIIDASRPMPPGGVMPEANTDVVGQWIDDGADCSTMGDSPTGGGTGDGGTDAVGPEAAAATVFDNSCVGCHQGTNPMAGVALDGNICDQTVNQVGSSGSILVVPFDAEASLLVQRMVDEVAPMPPGGLLAETEVDIVRAWINSGAECGPTGTDDGGSTGSEDSGNESGSDDGAGTGSDDGDADDSGMGDPSTSGGSTDGSDEIVDTGTEADSAAPTFGDVFRLLDADSTHCTACHDASSPAAGLNLNTEAEAYANLLAGGASAMVIPGDAEGSILYQRIVDAERPMPPTMYEMMPDSDVELIAAWINAGASE